MRPLPYPALDEALQRWWIGEPGALRRALTQLDPGDVAVFERLWWELSTMLGEVCGHLVVDHEGVGPSTAVFGHDALVLTGGGPQRVQDADALLSAWSLAIEAPPTFERHQRAARATFEQLTSDQHPLPDAAFALLRHHTEAPISLFRGRPLLQRGGRDALVQIGVEDEMASVGRAVSSVEACERHVEEGLGSSSLARADLAFRLTAGRAR